MLFLRFEEFVDQMYSELPKKAQEPVRIFVDGTATLAPVLGKYYHQYQHRKIDRAFKEMSPKLERIASKIESSEETELFKEEIFPVIVSKILNEPEEEKIKIIIDGFEHSIDKEITDLDDIFYYYDVLEKLRFSDIVFLIKTYPLTQKKESNMSQQIRHYKSFEEFLDREPFAIYVNNKLQNLGLIRSKENRNIGSAIKIPFELTSFGEKFCEFFLRDES